MDGLGNSTAISASGMRAQSERLRLLSENLANVDTPGFRRKMIDFMPDPSRDAKPGQIVARAPWLDMSPLERVHDPSHPMADAEGYHDGSNVNMIFEIADAREAQRSYEANLKMFEQARQMRRDLLEILRR